MQATQQGGNRAVIAAAFEAWQERAVPISSIFAPDMTWRIEGRLAAPTQFANSQEFIEQVLTPFGERFAKGERFRPVRVRSILADGDTVVVVWEGRGVANDGQPYENSYAWILQLRDGKVVDGTAFFDTIAFNELWERVPANG